MAVNRGGPVLTKEDRAAGRYLSKPSRVYRGTQSAVAVNWSGDTLQGGLLPGGWAANNRLLPQVDPTPMLPLRVLSTLRCQCPL